MGNKNYLVAYHTLAHMITEVITYNGEEFCLLYEEEKWGIPENKNRFGDEIFLLRTLFDRSFKVFEYSKKLDWFSKPPKLNGVEEFGPDVFNILTAYNDLTYASQKFPEREDAEESSKEAAYLDLLSACENFFCAKGLYDNISQTLIKLLPWRFINLGDDVSRYLAHYIPGGLKLNLRYIEGEREKIVDNVDRALKLVEDSKGSRNFMQATHLSRRLITADTLNLLDDKREWIGQAKKFIESIGLKKNKDTKEKMENLNNDLSKNRKHNPYLWYTSIGDINRLLIKVCEENEEEFYFKNACYAYALAKEKTKDKPSGLHLVLSRLSDSFILHLKWLINRDSTKAQEVANELIEVCKEWVSKTKNKYVPYINLGYAYYISGDYENSRKWYEEAKGVKSIDAPAYIGLYNLLLMQDKVEEAVKVLDGFRDTILNTTYSQRQRYADWLEFFGARSLHEAGFEELCVNRLIKILTETQPENSDAAELLVKVLSENPLEEFRKTILDKICGMQHLTSAQAHVVYSLSGSPSKQERQTEVSHQNEHEYLAQSYLEMARSEIPNSDDWKNYIQKCKEHNKILQDNDSGKKDIIIWDRLGRIYLMTGEIEEAKKLFEELRNIHSRDPYIPFRLAQCSIKENKYDEALKLLQKAYNMSPRIETLNDIGFCLIMLNKYNEAESFFKKILEAHPSDPLALYSLGIIGFEKGDYQEAADKWIESLNSKVQVSDELEGRKLYETIRTMDALVSCLKYEPGLWSKIFVNLKRNSQLFEILINRLATLSIFDSAIADEILEHYKQLEHNNRLKRRIAQYCMGRIIFLVHGLKPNETFDEWIRKVSTTITEPDIRAEFLAGAKGSYMRALRQIVAYDTIPDSIKNALQEIFDFSEDQILDKFLEIYKHVFGTINDASYYRTTENLFKEADFTDDEFIEYSQLQIKGFALKMISNAEGIDSLKCLCNGVSKRDKAKESINLLTNCPSVPIPYRIGSFIEGIKNQNNINLYSNSNSNSNEEQIKNLSIWMDDVAVKKLVLFCAFHTNHGTNPSCNYTLTKDGALKFTFSGQFKWPDFPRFNAYLQRNAVVKLREGFEVQEIGMSRPLKNTAF